MKNRHNRDIKISYQSLQNENLLRLAGKPKIVAFSQFCFIGIYKSDLRFSLEFP
jgi:hypothetical protein